MNRRQFLTSASVIVILLMLIFAGQDNLCLKVEAVTQQILPIRENATSMLGFYGSMPGPELRASPLMSKTALMTARQSIGRHQVGKPDGRGADADTGPD